MKINETGRIGGINPYRKAADHKQALSGSNRSKQKDEVQISTEAKELLNGVQHSDRVAELKHAVSTGTYQVDARKVAEKLWPYLN